MPGSATSRPTSTAAAYMVGITLVLFWLPVINGLLGGFVGGYTAGHPARGLVAAAGAGVAVALGLWLILRLLNAPVLGLISALSEPWLVLLSVLGLLAGALTGGTVARRDARMSA